MTTSQLRGTRGSRTLERLPNNVTRSHSSDTTSADDATRWPSATTTVSERYTATSADCGHTASRTSCTAALGTSTTIDTADSARGTTANAVTADAAVLASLKTRCTGTTRRFVLLIAAIAPTLDHVVICHAACGECVTCTSCSGTAPVAATDRTTVARSAG